MRDRNLPDLPELARQLAHEAMTEHGNDLHAASEWLFEQLEDEDLWLEIGADLLLLGCAHACRHRGLRRIA